MTTSSSPTFPAGTIVTGKWHRHQYRIERLLGEGANGRVYLVSEGAKLYAMKMGFDSTDHQSEINVLTALSQGGGHFRHFLRDADDYAKDNVTYPFYVMRWIKGEHLAAFMKRRGRDWIGPIGKQLLLRLSDLHERGWIFGDLKLDNILVTGFGDIELVDFGGVTINGRAVRQFTELYDRGHWGAGSRSADPGYDLFSFAIIVMQLIGRGRDREGFAKRALPQHRTLEQLLEEVEQDPGLATYRGFLKTALSGGYATAAEALAAWREASMVKPAASRTRTSGQARGRWLQAAFITALLLFFTSLLYLWR